jgi:hypothetical protein
LGGGKPRQVLRGMSSFFEDRFGEVIPRRFAGRNHVVRAVDPGKFTSVVTSTVDARENSCRCGGDVRGTSRGAHLISDDFQFFAFGGKPQDR